MIFEHQVLYPSEGELDEQQPDATDVWHSRIRRAGADLTLVTYGGSLHKSLSAADSLARERIEAEVIDLRCLRPLDLGPVFDSVRRTHRILVVDEGWATLSLAGEIIAQVAEHALYDLDAPPARVCSVEVPIPYAAHMEQAALPQPEKIVRAARELVARGG